MIRNTIVAIAALLLSTLSVYAGRGNDDGTPVATCYWATGVVSGVGSNLGPCASPLPVCDGTTDDRLSLESVTTWIVNTWQPAHTGKIALVWPNGKNCKIANEFNVQWAGIKDFLLWGYNGTMSGVVPHFSLGFMPQDAQHSVRVNAVASGSMSVTINPSSPTQPSNGCASIAACAALFNVGDWAVIAGGDLQGGTGFPPNPWQSQFVKIAAINSSSGLITFTEPIAQSYKTTWPNYNVPVPAVDYGGPPTLYALTAGWAGTADYRGLTIIPDPSFNQIDTAGRVLKFRDITCSYSPTGRACFAPTMTKTNAFYNVSTPFFTAWEMDKMVEDMVVDNSPNFPSNITFQSSGSNARLTINNSTLTGVTGNATITRFNNANITAGFAPGTTYGSPVSITANGGNIALLGASSQHDTGYVFQGGKPGDGLNNSSNTYITMASGKITVPNAYIAKYQFVYATNWFMPGENFCWGDNGMYNCTKMDQMTDITQDGVAFANSNITIASPAQVTLTAHGRVSGDLVTFQQYDVNGVCQLPTGMTCLQLEYVKTVIDANNFTFSDTNGGAAVNTTARGTGANPYLTSYGNTYIQTTACCGFPTWGGYSGYLTIKPHPAPQMTWTNVASADDATANLSLAPPKTPLYGYFKNNVTGVNQAIPYYFSMWGNLDKITATVLSGNQYNGALPANNRVSALFTNFMIAGTPPALVPTPYIPITLNTKSVGTRVLDAGSGTTATWTCTAGSCAGDTRVNLTQTSWCPTSWLNSGDDISSDPGNPMAASIEVLCRQNVVIPPLPPGWLP